MKLLFLTLLAAILVTETLAIRCEMNEDCYPNGLCLKHQCVFGVQCQKNYDCIKYGQFQECSNLKCVKSEYKLCRTNKDCPFLKKCKNQQCRWGLVKNEFGQFVEQQEEDEE